MLAAATHASAVDGLLAWSWTGPWEIALILVVILLLFGGRKLPEMARGLGRGLRIFKDEVKGVKSDVEDAGKDEGDDTSKTDGGDTPEASEEDTEKTA